MKWVLKVRAECVSLYGSSGDGNWLGLSKVFSSDYCVGLIVDIADEVYNIFGIFKVVHNCKQSSMVSGSKGILEVNA
jgi:hypothetical protein